MKNYLLIGLILALAGFFILSYRYLLLTPETTNLEQNREKEGWCLLGTTTKEGVGAIKEENPGVYNYFIELNGNTLKIYKKCID